MKWIGMLFIVGASGTVGVQIACSLKARSALFRRFIQALNMLQYEISCCRTPLPHAFAVLAAANHGELERIFCRTAKEMDKNRWMTPSGAMKLALSECHDPQLIEILRNLTDQLGKYDFQAQIQGIEGAIRQSEQVLLELEEARRGKTKVYQTLGISAGLAAAILLI